MALPKYIPPKKKVVEIPSQWKIDRDAFIAELIRSVPEQDKAEEARRLRRFITSPDCTVDDVMQFITRRMKRLAKLLDANRLEEKVTMDLVTLMAPMWAENPKYTVGQIEELLDPIMSEHPDYTHEQAIQAYLAGEG